MGIKFFLFAFVAILSLQGFADAKHVDTVDVSYNIEEILEAIKAIIEELKGYIKQGIQDIKDILKDIGAEIIAKLNEKIEEIKQQLNVIVEKVKAVWKMIEDHGKLCVECVVKSKDNFTNLVLNTSNELLTCSAPWNDAYAVLYQELNVCAIDLSDVWEAIENCSGPLWPLCVLEKIQKIPDIFEEVKAAVNTFITTVDESLESVTECSEKAIAAFHGGIEDIAHAIRDCINDETPMLLA